MKGAELRKRFLDFFKRQDHPILPSASLIPAADPTLLFTGAGMNPLKDYFLGLKHDLKKAASCQKCFRTGDLEKVGQTPSHLTFFEMLGNFSFGDYFKKEAIFLAWEFMTKELQISEELIWVSVYREDPEAVQIWHKEIGLPKERIVPFGAQENFWPSNAPAEGPNGPCGPCSELYYDYGRCLIGKTCPDPDHCTPGCPCGRFIEVWNLVFTQFDRQEGGKLLSLPMKNIDTGMGLERLTAVMQDKMSVFETDLFEPILEAMVHLLRREAPEVLRPDQRSYVYAIADHARALTFLIGDGVIPSNDGRGYVLRMLLRKASRHGRELGLEKPFLYQLVPVVAKVMESGYPDLPLRRESIAKLILAEEERFQENLEEKLPLLKEALRGLSALVPAEAARFYDTHGLSYEEIVEVCKKEKVAPPTREDFDKALNALQAKSKTQSGFSGAIWTKDALTEIVAQVSKKTDFVGYELFPHMDAKVIGLIQGKNLVKEAHAPAQVGLILDRSPFYGESGGQVGDAGILEGPEGKLQVNDTQWVGKVLFHEAQLLEGRIAVGNTVSAVVDRQRRRKVAQNHTATHLLHAALRTVLGGHVVQGGSLVAPDHLRFDFSHPNALSSSERESVESLVNAWIEEGLPVSVTQMPIEKARASGALALFGERYEDEVRVVSIGEVSKELCGGTHLSSSREIGLLTLVEEGSVAAGMRRLEALTAQQAFSFLKKESNELKEVASRLKASPEQAAQVVEKLIRQARSLEEQLERLHVEGAHEEAEKLADFGQKVGSFTFFAQKLEGERRHSGLRSFADAIRKRDPEAIIFLADSSGFCVATSSGAAQEKGISAKELFKVSAEVAGGSGGGGPQMAQGKIGDPSQFEQVKERLKQYLKERLNH